MGTSFELGVRVRFGFSDGCWDLVKGQGSGSGFSTGVGIGSRDGGHSRVSERGLLVDVGFQDGVKVEFHDGGRGWVLCMGRGWVLVTRVGVNFPDQGGWLFRMGVVIGLKD